MDWSALELAGVGWHLPTKMDGKMFWPDVVAILHPLLCNEFVLVAARQTRNFSTAATANHE